MKGQITKPSVQKQQYQKPEFQVIPLNMESPLLAESGVPTSINPLQRKTD